MALKDNLRRPIGIVKASLDLILTMSLCNNQGKTSAIFRKDSVLLLK